MVLVEERDNTVAGLKAGYFGAHSFHSAGAVGARDDRIPDG